MMSVDVARRNLLQLLRTRAFEKREVTLASGKKSNFYIDCKQVTLAAEGHVLVGTLLLEEIRKYERRTGRNVRGVGGLTLGADPIASAVAMSSALAPDALVPIPAFIVRKEPKRHGTAQYLEGLGNIELGSEVVVVEDVVTTGESAGKAVARVRDAGLMVNLILGLVDRLDGGRAHLEAQHVELVTLFDRRDFLDEA